MACSDAKERRIGESDAGKNAPGMSQWAVDMIDE
jgi:hypothetical protein